MKLNKIEKITGKIELLTGLHIGSGSAEMHIGGTDNPVIKNPMTKEPYIPGSSIKGKMRSLLEWDLGVVDVSKGAPLGFKHISEIDKKDQEAAKCLLKLFGAAPMPDTDDALIEEIGPTRLSFWDCQAHPDWIKEMDDKNLMLTETKMENSIDRIKGTAEHPRNMERVPAGAYFRFQLSLRQHDNEDLTPMIFKGIKLLEITGLGGSGSRGYGKIRFCLEGEWQERLDSFDLENAA